MTLTSKLQIPLVYGKGKGHDPTQISKMVMKDDFLTKDLLAASWTYNKLIGL